HRVEQDAGNALLGAATTRHEVLHRGIEADDDVLPRSAENSPEVAYDAAKRVDLDLAGSSAATQLAIVGLLDAVLADAKIGQLQHHAASIRLADVDSRSQRLSRGSAASGRLCEDSELVFLVFAGKRNAESVQYARAPRRQKPKIDAIRIGHHRVARALQELPL